MNALQLPPHPLATIFGQFYALDDFDVLEMLGEGFFSKVSRVGILIIPHFRGYFCRVFLVIHILSGRCSDETRTFAFAHICLLFGRAVCSRDLAINARWLRQGLRIRKLWINIKQLFLISDLFNVFIPYYLFTLPSCRVQIKDAQPCFFSAIKK